MERKLVTVKAIDEIKVHPNADLLELAIIGGWQCVVKKGEFKSGELVVFFEIDSIIPVKEEFEFLRASSYIKKNWMDGLIENGEGFRLKTIKLRKEVSQGLVIKMDENVRSAIDTYGLVDAEGYPHDFSSYFGVIKYDPPMNFSGPSGIPRGNFPHFIRKTDQERVQNIPTDVLQACVESGEMFEVTKKYHGSSLTCFFLSPGSLYEDEKHSGLGICSRNINLKIEENPDNHFIKVVFETNLNNAIKEFVEQSGIDIAIQGEVCGPGINQNYHSFDGFKLFIFDIFNITEQRYFTPEERFEILNKLFNQFSYTGNMAELYHIPEYTSGFFSRLPTKNYSDILKLAEYKLPNGKDGEGLVFKSKNRDFSFKVVSNAFLLNGGEETES